MRKDNERGAIVVEATISLTAFVFAIFTIHANCVYGS